MTPAEFIARAKVPLSLRPGQHGLWTIERKRWCDSILCELERDVENPFGLVGSSTYTLLWRVTDKSVHLGKGEIVMEDSLRELRKHLPIWMSAKGQVLVTGLGLGCVVRGLLANPDVTHIDVVEIDKTICKLIGPEFEGNPRVTLHLADALQWDFGGQCWDYAWHDLHSFDDTHLQVMHAELFCRFMNAVPLGRQGAWAWPREANRKIPVRLLGTRRRPSGGRIAA